MTLSNIKAIIARAGRYFTSPSPTRSRHLLLLTGFFTFTANFFARGNLPPARFYLAPWCTSFCARRRLRLWSEERRLGTWSSCSPCRSRRAGDCEISRLWLFLGLALAPFPVVSRSLAGDPDNGVILGLRRQLLLGGRLPRVTALPPHDAQQVIASFCRQDLPLPAPCRYPCHRLLSACRRWWFRLSGLFGLTHFEASSAASRPARLFTSPPDRLRVFTTA